MHSTLACQAVTRWLPESPAPAPMFEAAALPPASPTPMTLADLDVPPPALFETAWLDRSIYRSNLLEGEQAILDVASRRAQSTISTWRSRRI